jgi:hypothetical protein
MIIRLARDLLTLVDGEQCLTPSGTPVNYLSWNTESGERVHAVDYVDHRLRLQRHQETLPRSQRPNWL